MAGSLAKSGLRWLWKASCGQASRWPFRSWTTGTTSSRSPIAATGGSKSRLRPLVGKTVPASASFAEGERWSGTARSTWTHSSASTPEQESSCVCLLPALLLVRGSTGQTLIVGVTSVSSIASRHSAVDVLVQASAQEMKTVEHKESLPTQERPVRASRQTYERSPASQPSALAS